MKDPLIGGVIAAAAWLLTAHGEDTLARDLLIEYVGNVKTIRYHAEEYDLNIVKKLFPEIKRRLRFQDTRSK